jgi:UDP-glucose 4-epimerase
VFNIGTGRRTSVLELVDAVFHAAGEPPRVTFQPVRPGEVRHSVAAVTAAAEGLGFSARIGLEAGMASLWSAGHRARAA